MRSLLIIALFINAVSAKQLCSPGTVFKMDCNFCTCTSDGLLACTDMACSASELTRNNDKFCEPDSTFSPDECNKCRCNADGTTALCTMVYCPKNLKAVRKIEFKQVCKPLSQFKDYCNTCACADDGLSFACTRMMCDENLWNKDGTLKFTKQSAESTSIRICEPNTQFKDDCNVCMCSNDGLSKACTMMHCVNNDLNIHKRSISKANSPICYPNSQFQEYCNTCICSMDGLSKACTMMDCDKDLFNIDGSLKKSPSSLKNVRSAKSLACTPNSQFMESCNSCACSNDGMTKICTMMACEE